ncbi:uncharacterized protein DSM5745_05507 [Aspergillus mulundensis]|uniref:Uncharacterized protein n=1 Tax=Aspergillus mulundensis TaxID=1810919 RepID=A0A3D8RXA4_9EURO|nr:Uncharacterized protein DSM5745_05507 [Aspergillus mulundensis]RDW78655.1 Uncharacterized protein DSM5745_05507 [Aspergillus mulundensis]
MSSRTVAMVPTGPLHRGDRIRSDGPQARVDELVRKYRKANAPSAVMLEVFNDADTYSLLVGALRRQVALSKCRSQEFEDCQVTIYDRALLILSNYGESATDPGALELYLTEFLGIVPIAPISDGVETVSKHVEVQNVLNKAIADHEHSETAVAAPSKEFKREEEAAPSSPFNIDVEYSRYFPDSPAYDDENIKHAAPLDPSSEALKDDVRVARLLEVYQQAKEDYFNTKTRDGFESLSAVRFLRDSAENTLRYFHANGLSDNCYVPDLEHTFAIARDKTAQLLGGRKRHFDDDTGNWSRQYHFNRSRSKRRSESRGEKRSRRIVDSYRPHA